MPEILNVPLLVLLFVGADIVTGTVQAVANKNLRSDKLRQGLFHKLAFVFAMAFGYLVEYAMGVVDMGFAVPIAAPVCAYICLTEAVSIGENIIKMNPELAQGKFATLLDEFKTE